MTACGFVARLVLMACIVCETAAPLKAAAAATCNAGSCSRAWLDAPCSVPGNPLECCWVSQSYRCSDGTAIQEPGCVFVGPSGGCAGDCTSDASWDSCADGTGCPNGIGEQEVCYNGVDDNFDGCVDEGCIYGHRNCSCTSSCEATSCNPPKQAKCDPRNGNRELCNGIDDNCNGRIDEGCSGCKGREWGGASEQSGACCPLMVGGDPISLVTQSTIAEPFTDFSATAVVTLGITRTYTSADASVQSGAQAGIFGRGWHHDWEASLTCDQAQGSCMVTRGLNPGLEFASAGTAMSTDGSEELILYRAFTSNGYQTDHPHILVRHQDGKWTLFLTDGTELWFDLVCDSACEGVETCVDALAGGRARLVRVVDRVGNVVDVSYDRALGSLLKLSDDLGHTLDLRSDSACADGRARELWYDGSRFVTYQYANGDADLGEAKDADGNALRSYEYTLDGVGLLWKVKNEAGDAVATFSYDSELRANGVIDASSTVDVSYVSNGSIDVTEHYGVDQSSVSTRTLTSDGQIGSIGGGCSCGPAKSFTWAHGTPQCITDSLGHVTYTSSDELGRVTRSAEYSTQYACPPTQTELTSTDAREEWFTYGLTKTIAVGVVLPRNQVTETRRRSGAKTSGTYMTETTDYDPSPKSEDPAGYSCQAVPLRPGSAPCRKIVKGYVEEPNSTQYTLHRFEEFFSYDGRGRLTRKVGPITIEPAKTGEATPIEERSYWPENESLARRGRLHEVKRYPAPANDPLVTTYDYDAFGVYKVTGPRGDLTTFVKDGRGRTTFVMRADNRSEETRYYDGPSPRLRLLPSGAVVRWAHDSVGRTTSVEHLFGDPDVEGAEPTLGWSEHYQYDAAGNVAHTERRDALGRVTWTQDRKHDVQGRVVSESHPADSTKERRWDYDASGFLGSFTDEEGRSTTFTPDPLSRVDEVTRSGLDATGVPISRRVASYSYRTYSGTLERAYDGKTNVIGGQSTSYVYDDFARLTEIYTTTFANAGSGHQYVYDAGGNIESKTTDSRMVVQTYAWDGLGRVTSAGASSTRTNESIAYTYVYDERGHDGLLTTVIEPERTIEYDYDIMGRLKKESVLEAGVSVARVTEYDYDADGDLTLIRYPTGLAVRYERDPATKDIVKVRQDPAGVVYADAVAHYPAGPLSSLTFGSGAGLTQSLDLRYQPSAIQSGPVSLAYAMTRAGDVQSIEDTSTAWNFGYDFLDRLSRMTPGHVGEPTYSFNYYLDRITMARSPNASGTLKNRYAFAYDGHGGVSAIGQYDANGSNVSRAVCLRRDPLGRLVKVSTVNPNSIVWGDTAFTSCTSYITGDVARFKYDHRNRRVARWLASTNEWTYFAHAPDGTVLSEETLTSDPAAPWSPRIEYVWLDGLPIAQVERTTPTERNTYYLHVDHIGLPRAMTNSAGQTVWSASPTRPYGDIVETTTTDPLSGRTVVTNLRLPGQYDERLFAVAGITGLQGPYYNWNRWYLPSVGRYLELDLIALEGGLNGRGEPDWYNYGLGNPNRYVDPEGDVAVAIPPLIWGIGIVVGAWETYVAQCTANHTCPWDMPICRTGPPPRGKGYKCMAKCQANGSPSGAYYVFGESDRNCGLAILDAKANVPLGQYPRHCSCSDTDGFYGVGRQCEAHTR